MKIDNNDFTLKESTIYQLINLCNCSNVKHMIKNTSMNIIKISKYNSCLIKSRNKIPLGIKLKSEYNF